MSVDPQSGKENYDYYCANWPQCKGKVSLIANGMAEAEAKAKADYSCPICRGEVLSHSETFRGGAGVRFKGLTTPGGR